jgi:pimeloyl-ACP methyl ester carboxylesterase
MNENQPPPEALTPWGGSGPTLVFSHANGFPPATYRILLDDLRGHFRVVAFAARPLWPGSDPLRCGSWHDLAEDLRRSMTAQGLRRVVGLGHSLGGVLSVIAAAAAPDLFSALVLVDPVIFAGFHRLFWGTLRGLGIGHRLPLIRGARRRRDRFPHLDAVRSSYEGKAVFGSWSAQVLEDYIRSAFTDDGQGGVVLRYSKTWESRIFELTTANVWPSLRRLDMPMLFVRGARSETFTRVAANRVRREMPRATVVEIPGTTHFLPMERPQQIAAVITEWARGFQADG